MIPTEDPLSINVSSTMMTPTISPNTYIPTQSPTNFKGLHFVCRYNDDEKSALRHLSYTGYARSMEKMILKSIQTIFARSIDYEEDLWDVYKPWRRGGISSFIICNIFDTSLQDDCPKYGDTAVADDGEYIAIGLFGIVANQQLTIYQEQILSILTGDSFRNTFTQNMNEELNNVTSRRRLLEYTSFEAIKVNVIDPLNDTNHGFDTTTEEPDDDEFNQDNTDNSSTTTTIILVLVVVLMLVMIFCGYVVFRKYKDRNGEVGKGQTENEGGAGEYLKKEIEMNKTAIQEDNANIDDEGLALPLTRSTNTPYNNLNAIHDTHENDHERQESSLNETAFGHEEAIEAEDSLNRDILAAINNNQIEDVDGQEIDDEILNLINDTHSFQQ